MHPALTLLALDVHTREFLEHPNRTLVRNGQRLAIAPGSVAGRAEDGF